MSLKRSENETREKEYNKLSQDAIVVSLFEGEDDMKMMMRRRCTILEKEKREVEGKINSQFHQNGLILC